MLRSSLQLLCIKHSGDRFGPSPTESLDGDSIHSTASTGSIYFEGINDLHQPEDDDVEDECVLDIQIPLRVDDHHYDKPKQVHIPRKCRKTDIDQLLLKKNQQGTTGGSNSSLSNKSKKVDPSKLTLSSSLLESLSGQLSLEQPTTSNNSHQPQQSKRLHGHRHRRTSSKEELLRQDSAHSIRSLLSLDKIIEEHIKAERSASQTGQWQWRRRSVQSRTT